MRKNNFAVFIVILLILIPSTHAEYYNNVTREDALNAIHDAEKAISEMMNAGFSVQYVNDTLTEAKKAFQRAEFAEILRTQAHGALAEKAKQALEGLNWKGFTYADVLTYTDEIMKRKEWAFRLNDKITATEIKAKEYDALGIDVSEALSLINQSKEAFREERYEDAEVFIQKADEKLEEARAQLTLSSILRKSGGNFIKQHWKPIVIIIILSFLSSLIFWEKYRRVRIEGELTKLRLEMEVIEDLMKKTQVERFKEGKISEKMYRIRMEKYRKRLAEIKAEIPVLETLLKEKRIFSFHLRKK